MDDKRVQRAFSAIYEYCNPPQYKPTPSQHLRHEQEYLRWKTRLYTIALNAERASLNQRIRCRHQISTLRKRVGARVEAQFIRVLERYGYPTDNGPYYDPSESY
ncbi:hypothetical protein C8F04DRAFT_1271645 [Mycena alexandri]|uniref:Uncharacterized protein n=1 Tax=Mycena alexandri TaxID=1745969 RepID=A0AAD6S971_9AGAR|nr:hypothetical protein C8F04DRAFT_1271645 [Mycena alexandri]